MIKFSLNERILAGSIALSSILYGVISYAKPALAACDGSTLTVQDGINCAKPASSASGNIGTIFATVADVLIFVIGAISVVMIIIGGLRYVLSAGNAASVKAARDTILYAIVGLVVSVLAFAVVSFILGRFGFK